MSVVQDDRTVEIRELGGMRGARALALVAERAGSSVTREELADVVWDGRPPASWASNLRLVVSALRRVVGVDALTVGPDGYRLVLPRSQVDLLELERATFEAERLPACEGWRPAVDALPPVDWVPLRGIDGSYADAVRRRVAELRRRLTLAIATGALELGLVREAEHHARDLIVADPLREDGHRLLMSALAASGNVGAALSAYETCRAVLADELGADPSPLTEGLFLSLLRDNGGRSAPATGATPARHRRVVTFAIEAAATAVRAGLFEDAELQARRGLAALQSTGAPDPALQRRLEVLRAAAARHLGDVAASHRLSDLAQDALVSGDQRAVMDVALAGTSRGTVGDGAFADHGLMETYRVALERLGPAQEAARACLLGHVATSLAWREDGATGRTLAAEAVGLARDSGSPESLFTTLLSQRQAIAGQLDVDLQDRLEQEMETLAEELDDPVGRTRVAVHRFITAVERGDGDRLEDLLAVAAGHGEQTDSMLLAHQLDYTRAGLRLLRGDLAAAAQQIEGAAHAGRRAGVDPTAVEGVRLVAMVSAWEALGELPDHRDQVAAVFAAGALPESLPVLARVESVCGDHGAARDALESFLAAYDERGGSMIAPVAVVAMTAPVIARLGDTSYAERVYPWLEPHAGRGGYVAHFLGPVDLALGLLAETLGERGRAVEHYRAGEDFCRRLGAPVLAERCRALADAVTQRI